MKVVYGTTMLGDFETMEELSAFLNEIRKSYRVKNPMVELLYTDEIRLLLGLSETWCTASYTKEGYGYYIQPKRRNDSTDVIAFMYDGHETEQYLRNCVDFELIIKAVGQFFADGECPKAVEWEKLGK